MGSTPGIHFWSFASMFTGQEVELRHLSVSAMLPQTDDYVTYEGSLSQPGCQETVTWVIFNKPIYVTSQHVCIDRSVSKMKPMD